MQNLYFRSKFADEWIKRKRSDCIVCPAKQILHHCPMVVIAFKNHNNESKRKQNERNLLGVRLNTFRQTVRLTAKQRGPTSRYH